MSVHFQSVTVLGAGTMGHGIAHVCALAGLDTVLYDVDLGAVDTGLKRIRSHLDAAVSSGDLTNPERDEVLNRIQRSSDLAFAVQGAQLIIEAAPESMDIKRGLFRLLEQRVGEDTVFATNTSSLSISELASGMEHPARFLGVHFFNPVHEIDLVEVVWGVGTSDATLALMVEFVESLGKRPIVVRDSPGFASSRLGVVLCLEAIRMVEAGVTSAEDIDKAMGLAYGHPVGPLMHADMVGLDVEMDAAVYLHEALGSEAFRPPDLLERMVADGKLGRKSGEGFYSWHKDGRLDEQ
jgi:3-hydroxybutyryl-CoA dehydrogenase